MGGSSSAAATDERVQQVVAVIDAVDRSGVHGLDIHGIMRAIEPIRLAYGRSMGDRACKVAAHRIMRGLWKSLLFEYKDDRVPHMIRRIRR
jgi:hypothetical protein